MLIFWEKKNALVNNVYLACIMLCFFKMLITCICKFIVIYIYIYINATTNTAYMQQEFEMLDHSLHHPLKKKYDEFKATLVQHKISFGNYFLFFPRCLA